MKRKLLTFDGVYHCKYCDKKFNIPGGLQEFLGHQNVCPKRPFFVKMITKFKEVSK